MNELSRAIASLREILTGLTQRTQRTQIESFYPFFHVTLPPNKHYRSSYFTFGADMFCPNCGKDNSLDLKYCASCGTNLEAVSLALTGKEEDFFTKMDAGIDQFVARYAEHVFRTAPQGISERKVSKSWKLLGQAVVTTFVDILLFSLMWNILPLRFLILCISTPFRLLAERGNENQHQTVAPAYRGPELSEARSGLWLTDTAPSVTENTTKHLDQITPTERKAAVITDQLSK